MIFIGITGGIGSGKSTVCSIFQEKGVPVFSADLAARRITESDALPEIQREFGPEIITEKKQLDRKKLAEIVFKDQKKLLLLNAIVHPYVFDEVDRWKKERARKKGYSVIEAALMFETQMHEMVDYILAVVADELVRLQRVAARDHIDELQVKARMHHQLPTEEVLERSDFQLNNSGTRESLNQKINFFHTLFTSLQPRKEVE